MSQQTSKCATVYCEPGLHQAIRLKAAHTNRSSTEIVNDAVRAALREDQEDLSAFEDRRLGDLVVRVGHRRDVCQ
jgi:hypothetical protein